MLSGDDVLGLSHPTPLPLPAPKAITPFPNPHSTYIHDAVLLRVEEEPIIEQSQFGIRSSNIGLEKENKQTNKE